MRKLTRRTMVWSALVSVVALSLSGCSIGAGISSSSNSEKKPDSITVWSMNGDLSPEVLKVINEKFTKQTGVKVKLETHDWSGITTKVTTALSTSNPPDVIDVGNTQLSGYAANGGLLDITSKKSGLKQGKTWVKGLEDSATYGGKLYGVPALLAPFAVLYNKTIWKAAGVTSVPQTYDELKQDLTLVKSKEKSADFSAMYLCGKDWYSALQWVWAAGGDVARESNGTWKGTLSSSASLRGLQDWKEFQNNYSNVSSRTLSTDSPDQTQLFAQGKTSAIVAPSTSITAIEKLKTGVTASDIGSFAIPTTQGKFQPTFTSGSDWVVPRKSKNSIWSLKWISIATSPELQEQYAYKQLNLNPITVEGNEDIEKKVSSGNIMQGYIDSAKASVSTPTAAGWLKVEGNAVLEGFFSSIASGAASPQQAAAKVDSQLDDLLNSKD